MIVVDNALICYLLISGDFTNEAERIRSIDPRWIAPPLWLSEFRNVLRNYMNSELLTLPEALKHLALATELMHGAIYEAPSEKVLELAAASGCTAYDCEYVALAIAADLPLVTTDKQVLNAFPDVAIALKNFR